MRVLRAYPVQPLDRVVGHRIGEVVRIFVVVEPRVGPDDLLVLGQTRIPLTRTAAEDPVEVVEAPAVRPPVERPGRTLLTVGCQVPLAERGRAVTVVAKDPGQRRAVSGQDRGVAREPTRELADRPEADRVVVATGQQRRTRRRAQRGDVEPVVAHSPFGDARVVRGLDRTAERARVPETGVVDEDQQDVRRTFRRGRMPDEVPVGLRPVERPVDDSVERLPANREPAAVDLAHLQRPPRVPAVTRADSLPALNRVSGLGPGSSVSALCAVLPMKPAARARLDVLNRSVLVGEVGIERLADVMPQPLDDPPRVTCHRRGGRVVHVFEDGVEHRAGTLHEPLDVRYDLAIDVRKEEELLVSLDHEA